MEKLGPESVVIVSLTKAAAHEIAGRVQIPRERVGTLHSICLHAGGLSGRPVLDSSKGLPMWNDWIKKINAAWQLNDGVGADDPLVQHEATSGMQLLERLNLLRHRMVPVNLWPESVLEFARAWNAAMEDLGATDFTGMIEAGLDMETAPFAPRLLVGDEAQDWSRLEGSVIRKWAQHAETTLIAGDEDQSIFSFRGSDPRIFSDFPVPHEQRRPLRQSWRVPRDVHDLAQRIIRGVRTRTDNPYLPTPEKGHVEIREDCSWRRPENWIDDVLRDSENGGAMVLASCAYLLVPFLSIMKRDGIPFHNPMCRARGAWNPLGNPNTENNTAARQLLAYLGGEPDYWHVDDLKAWIPLLANAKHKVALMDDDAYLRHGVKAWLSRAPGSRLSPQEYLGMFQDPETGVAAFQRGLEWLRTGANDKDRKRLEFPMAILRRGGADLLRAEPKIIVSTVHGAKGSESKHVYVLTALPNRWSEDQGDEITRLFYVACTRAKYSVTLLCGDRGGFDGF